ncbi:hypothetical protein BD309DRAFT_897071 [Dichomitus squalens]|uniref:DUF6533 domain-containing protein n=1 Tax=Dichomitus squalens TaxID=114155 RepID=A0A4Q9PZV5_9APHY|nr:hypothetical protein BD309DRAFT_897071 [Dichomitus squalens]TBU60382.1 hypothetical protein BD310DRAFT_875453 [Dichomitus squalens]
MATSNSGQLALQYSQILIDNRCFFAGIVVFLYDTMITTGEEIRCFWGRKLTAAAVLFWMNKYMTMIFLVWDLASYFNISNASCAASAKGTYAVNYSIYLVWAAFTAMRIYALRKNMLLSVIAFALSVVPFGVNLVTFRFGLTGEDIDPFGCTEIAGVPVNLSKTVTIVSRSSLIAADCLAIGATWLTLVRLRVIGHIGLLQGSLASILLLDGTIYFLLLGIINCLHIAFTLLSLDIVLLQSTSGLVTFTTPISAVILSRFLLRLQSASLRGTGSMPPSQVSSPDNRSIVFERVVSSLGASIAVEDYLGQDDGLGGDDIVDMH